MALFLVLFIWSSKCEGCSKFDASVCLLVCGFVALKRMDRLQYGFKLEASLTDLDLITICPVVQNNVLVGNLMIPFQYFVCINCILPSVRRYCGRFYKKYVYMYTYLCIFVPFFNVEFGIPLKKYF